MQGAIKRLEREAEARNLQTYNGAALIGAAMVGKIPRFDKVFPDRKAQIAAGSPQSAAVLEANLRSLARTWGAT